MALKINDLDIDVPMVKADVGLGNVDNTSDIDKPVSTVQQTAIDDAVVGVYDDQGNYDAATDSPSLDDGSPIGGILQGHMYTVGVAGNFFTIEVEIGDVLRALQDTPTVEAHWAVTQANLTPASIKTQYESNADTNEFTDAEKTELTKFVSEDLVITSDSEVVLQHELGVEPTQFDYFLVCQTPEFGYIQNDVVTVYSRATFIQNTFISIVPDDTDLTVTFGTAVAVFRLLNKNTRVDVAATNASWKLRIIARP